MPFDTYVSRLSASSPSRPWMSVMPLLMVIYRWSSGPGRAPAGAAPPGGRLRASVVAWPTGHERARPSVSQFTAAGRSSSDATRRRARSTADRTRARLPSGTTRSATTSVREARVPPAWKKRRRTRPTTTTRSPAASESAQAGASSHTTGTDSAGPGPHLDVSSMVTSESPDGSRRRSAGLDSEPLTSVTDVSGVVVGVGAERGHGGSFRSEGARSVGQRRRSGGLGEGSNRRRRP